MWGCLDNWLSKRALISPDKRALIYEDQSWTFSELYDASRHYAYTLRQALSQQQKLPERVGLMCANSATSYVCIMALMNLGVQIVMFNTRLSAAELEYQIRDSEIPFLLYSCDYESKARLAMEAAADTCQHDSETCASIDSHPHTGIHHIQLIAVDSIWDTLPASLRFPSSVSHAQESSAEPRTSVTASPTPVTDILPAASTSKHSGTSVTCSPAASIKVATPPTPSLEELASATRPEFPMDEVMSILYTSGTTGEPKGVMQTYGNHYFSATASMLNAGLEPSDAWAAFTPLYHISGLSILLRSFIYGIPVYLYRTFDAARINRDILGGRVRIVSVVAYALEKLLDDLGDRAYPPSFRYMLLGGGFFADSLLEECARRNIPVIRSFGMSETCSQIIATPLRSDYVKPGSSGLPLFANRVRIDGDTGEIQIISPALCCGYLNKEEQYRASFTPDGWYKTGDIGSLDSDGYLYVKSRLAEMIISGGENIYPCEIEQCLEKHPAIREAAVVGKPDETWGYVPWGYVTPAHDNLPAPLAPPLPSASPAPPASPRPPAPAALPAPLRAASSHERPSDEEIVAFLRKHLAGYKIPKKIIWLDSLPKTSLGKIQKFKLLDLENEN